MEDAIQLEHALVSEEDGCQRELGNRLCVGRHRVGDADAAAEDALVDESLDAAGHVGDQLQFGERFCEFDRDVRRAPARDHDFQVRALILQVERRAHGAVAQQVTGPIEPLHVIPAQQLIADDRMHGPEQ